MEFINHYIFLVVPVCGWFVAQFIKPFAHYMVTRVWESKRWYTSSGMPSSHSSTMSSLTTIIGVKTGFASVEFAISLIVAIIVMYDAKGVRNASGKHAEYLNMIMDDINQFFRNGLSGEYFKTELGHNTLQVFCGMALGVVVALLIAFVTGNLLVPAG